MAAFLIVLLLLALLGILGGVLKGLLWLIVIAALLFVAGSVFGFLKFKSNSN